MVTIGFNGSLFDFVGSTIILSPISGFDNGALSIDVGTTVGTGVIPGLTTDMNWLGAGVMVVSVSGLSIVFPAVDTNSFLTTFIGVGVGFVDSAGSVDRWPPGYAGLYG